MAANLIERLGSAAGPEHLGQSEAVEPLSDLEAAAISICRSRKYETGQGTCALICMDQLGDVRAKGCHHANRVHADKATALFAKSKAERRK